MMANGRRRGLSLIARVGIAATLALLAGVLTAGASSATDLSIVTNPTWSPDGTQLAFAYTADASYRVVTAPASGAGPIQTVWEAKNQDGCCDPMLWSRSSNRILFDSNFTLLSVPPGGAAPTRLAGNISWFTLSPNEETAAFDGPQDHSPSSIGLVNVTGGEPRLVPRPAAASDAVAGFSPDGTDLVFDREASFGSSSRSVLMVEELRGGTPLPLGRSGLIGAARLPAAAVSPQWSPDGRWIAFEQLGKLNVVSTNGSAVPRTLAGWLDGAFSWSPTSKLLACFCGPN
jgi:Tol biopolymer transport system component